MSVNFAAAQLERDDVVDDVRTALALSQLSPERLVIEITETTLMIDVQQTLARLRQLKAIGVRIAIDDFGTGYSSLSYLKRFPIDTLKLDQAFVRGVLSDPSDAAIVSAVISMAHSLDLEVVAEGVETAEQLSFLQSRQCDRIQGYYFSAPLTAAEMEPYLLSSAAASM
jgi:EAL domain-containing protein (putative c-di-GMP-specific phosphodiesterase class I)